MKKIIVSLFAASCFGATAFAQQTPSLLSAESAPKAASLEQQTPPPAFKWTETTHDFGAIPQGKPATVRFEFVNTGKSDLIVTNAKPGCGCTTPTWTKEAIKPGEKGYVDATYNAAAAGFFTKNVTVESNAEGGAVILYLKGEVKAPAAEPTTTTPAPAAGH